MLQITKDIMIIFGIGKEAKKGVRTSNKEERRKEMVMKKMGQHLLILI